MEFYYLTLDFNSLTIGSLKGYLSKLRYYDTGYKPDTQTNPTGILKDVTIDDYQTYTDGVKLTDTLGTDYPNKVTIKVIPEALYDFLIITKIYQQEQFLCRCLYR